MPTDRYITHYALGEERDRLSSGGGRLERDRTRVVLARTLPAPPARVLDVGGAAGVHARWLADAGYDVTLLDPVPLHIEQARAESARGRPFTVRLGDACVLSEVDNSWDAVLLLGPLYHLVEPADRLTALREATRVARSGAPVVAAAGLADIDVIGLEGAGCLLPDLDERYADREAWAQLPRAAQRLEREPSVIGVSSHLMATGRAP